MLNNLIGLIALAAALIVLLPLTLYTVTRRRVVPTNEVHIVQTAKKVTSYGKDQTAGNVYYHWPAWLPLIGLKQTTFPVSNFEVELDTYEAYDRERVPFVVDVVAFMRIENPNTAAQRISNFAELEAQLGAIVRGAVRTVLANHEIDQIMIDRSTFGEYFTKEVEAQLGQWGVVNVKNIELMDIRDARGSEVIHNIMAKRTSAIARDSRVAVANNNRTAEIAEIEATRETDLTREQARQAVGQRTAEAEKEIGIATERAQQEVATERRTTTERLMEVKKVEDVKKAEIAKDVAIVSAEEQAQTQIINAEADKKRVVLEAEASLEEAKRDAEGIQAIGSAKASAEREMQMAPVTAQIELAKEIGNNDGYQKYLVNLEQIKASMTVGLEQAKALQAADIKVITNAGAPAEGLSGVMDLFTAKGGTNLVGMIEALRQSDTGRAVVDKVVGGKTEKTDA